jgi:hypothetical protein
MAMPVALALAEYSIGMVEAEMVSMTVISVGEVARTFEKCDHHRKEEKPGL